jgi:GAF domain-containing protein
VEVHDPPLLVEIDAPIGLLTLVDRARQFFLAAHGLPDPLASARQTSLDYSLCQYAATTGRPLIVGDIRADPVLAANPAVSQMGVLAYAGIPMIDPDGHLADIATELCGEGLGWTGFEEAGHVASAR